MAVRALFAGCVWAVAVQPVRAATWSSSAWASVTETYTTNVDYSPRGQESSDWVTSLAGGFRFNGRGARVQVGGSVAASWQVYATERQNNSIAPTANLFGRVEAIENFFFVDATATVSTSFLSPFGPQPESIVNATGNRYLSQTYSVTPYFQGVLGASNISYVVRDANIWTISTAYGNSTNSVPNTYANSLSASMSRPPAPVGWTLQYSRSYYDNGTSLGSSTDEVMRLIVPYQIDPQLQVSGRVGYERYTDFSVSNESSIYGVGAQWNPTDRTSVGGYWEERFFGSSYNWHISHRLPNAAISANFARGLNNYPQLALAIPAGTTVSQFLDAAFTTRIPDPAERAIAVEEFLARTGLPPTLAAPVNFYGQTASVQDTASVALVLLGVRQSVTFTVFYVDSNQVSGKGQDLPPQFAFGQDNTQTGVGASYGYRLSGFTNLSANASYSRTKANDSAANGAESENFNVGAHVSRALGPKTSASAGVTYSYFRPISGQNTYNTSTLNAFVTVSHTF